MDLYLGLVFAPEAESEVSNALLSGKSSRQIHESCLEGLLAVGFRSRRTGMPTLFPETVNLQQPQHRASGDVRHAARAAHVVESNDGLRGRVVSGELKLGTGIAAPASFP